MRLFRAFPQVLLIVLCISLPYLIPIYFDYLEPHGIFICLAGGHFIDACLLLICPFKTYFSDKPVSRPLSSYVRIGFYEDLYMCFYTNTCRAYNDNLLPFSLDKLAHYCIYTRKKQPMGIQLCRNGRNIGAYTQQSGSIIWVFRYVGIIVVQVVSIIRRIEYIIYSV